MKRDIEIFTNLGNAPHSLSQIAWEFFRGVRTNANRRMRKLLASGLARREPIPDYRKAGRCEYAYSLSKAGARMLRDTFGMQARAQAIKYHSLMHTLMVNELRIRFKFALQDSDRLVSKFYYAPTFNAIIPDGMLILQLRGCEKTAILFLEVDRSTETWVIIEGKMTNYHTLLNCEDIVRTYFPFPVSFFRILFVMDNDSRAEKLCQLFDSDLFLCSTLEELTGTSDVLQDDIWKDLSGKNRSIEGVLKDVH